MADAATAAIPVGTARRSASWTPRRLASFGGSIVPDAIQSAAATAAIEASAIHRPAGASRAGGGVCGAGVSRSQRAIQTATSARPTSAARVLEDRVHGDRVARERPEVEAQCARDPHDRGTGVGESVPGDVRQRPHEERDRDGGERRPCARREQRRAADARSGRKQIDDRRRERAVEERVAERTGRQTEPEQPQQIVALGACDAERQEVREVGHHAADHQRREDGVAAERAAQRHDGRRVREGERHG